MLFYLMFIYTEPRPPVTILWGSVHSDLRSATHHPCPLFSRPTASLCEGGFMVNQLPLSFSVSTSDLQTILSLLFSHSCALFCTHQKDQLFCFQSIPHSFHKTPGVGRGPLLTSDPTSVFVDGECPRLRRRANSDFCFDFQLLTFNLQPPRPSRMITYSPEVPLRA